MKKIGFIIVAIGILIYFNTINILNALCNYDDKPVRYHKSSEYILDNYALIFILIGILFVKIFYRGWNNFRIPKRKRTVTFIGVGAIFATLLIFIEFIFYEIIQGSHTRSLYYDIKDFVVIIIPLLIWFFAHQSLIFYEYNGYQLVKNSITKNSSFWLKSILFFTLAIALFSIYGGRFTLTLTSVTWSYYYLCLLIGSSKIEKTKANNVYKK
jgi:hypothetical protein